MAADGPTERELAESRQFLIGSLPRRLETNVGIANFMQMVEFFGLGMDYDLRVPDLLARVTRDDVHAAARAVLDGQRARRRRGFLSRVGIRARRYRACAQLVMRRQSSPLGSPNNRKKTARGLTSFPMGEAGPRQEMLLVWIWVASAAPAVERRKESTDHFK